MIWGLPHPKIVIIFFRSHNKKKMKNSNSFYVNKIVTYIQYTVLNLVIVQCNVS